MLKFKNPTGSVKSSANFHWHVCNTVDHKEKVSLINHIAEKDGFVIAVYKFIKNKNAQS